MSRLILLLALLLVIYLLLRQYKKLEPAQQKALLWRLAVGGFLALILAALLTGRLNWIGALVMGALPFLKGLFGALLRAKALHDMWRKLRPEQTMHAGSLQLLMRAGRADGQIKQGQHAGRYLSDLSEPELDQLLRHWRQQDPPAAALLQGYLIGRFGNNWQGAAWTDNGDGKLSETEARAMLGVAEDAGREDIIKAHRRLMQKFHPDRGGSDYLAARINQAKEVLLERLGNP